MFEIGNLLKVQLTSTKGDVAEFEFEEMPYNEFLMLQAGAKEKDAEKLVDSFGNLVQYCHSVKNVHFAHSGEELSLERLKQKNVPTSFMFALCNAYIKAMTLGIQGEDDPKKDSAEAA